jgi:hypothetical protein
MVLFFEINEIKIGNYNIPVPTDVGYREYFDNRTGVTGHEKIHNFWA